MGVGGVRTCACECARISMTIASILLASAVMLTRYPAGGQFEEDWLFHLAAGVQACDSARRLPCGSVRRARMQAHLQKQAESLIWEGGRGWCLNLEKWSTEVLLFMGAVAVFQDSGTPPPPPPPQFYGATWFSRFGARSSGMRQRVFAALRVLLGILCGVRHQLTSPGIRRLVGGAGKCAAGVPGAPACCRQYAPCSSLGVAAERCILGGHWTVCVPAPRLCALQVDSCDVWR
jgi:hypothetical protein